MAESHILTRLHALQLLMKVSQTTHITISLNQPDTRMKSKQMGKSEFDRLYLEGCGYDEHIGFTVFKGSARKMRYSSKDIVGDASYTGVRTVSTVIPDCPPGQYIIVPTTFDPNIMDFHMRLWADKSITVVDTRGGRDFQIYDASLDGLDKQTVPLSLGVGQILATEDLNGLPAGSEQTDIIQKHSQEEACVMAGMLVGITDGLKRASWKVGDLIPRSWQHGDDFLMAPTNTFQQDEISAIMRSDRSIRFAKISQVMGNNTYEVMVSHSPHGSLYKTGVPAQYLGKLSQQGGYPRALVEQVGRIFDLLDADGSGYLEVRRIASEIRMAPAK